MKICYSWTTTKKHNETNDCVVHAMSHSFGIEYTDALEICAEEFKRKPRRGVDLHKFGIPLTDGMYVNGKMSKAIIRHSKTEKWLSKWWGSFYKFIEDIPKENYTLGKFKKKFNKGSYFIVLSGHAVTIKDGEVIDWDTDKDKDRRLVEIAWKIKDLKIK